MKKNILVSLIGSLLAVPALAVQPFTVKDIRIEGIQRTEAGTVFSYLPVKVGETFTDEKAAQAIKALFATGFFKDVRIETEGDVLVVSVQERPAIAHIDFVGLKEFDKEQIKKALKDSGIAESRIFDRSLLEKAEQELKRQYMSRGKYAVTITTTVTPLERNRVGINFNIEEGEIAKIRQINLVGTKAFKEGELLELMEQRTPGWFSWFSKSDQYSRQKMAADLEKLRSFYLNQGYLDFNIESTQVSISPDKQDVYLTINLTEGEQYTVSGIKLSGDLILAEEELRKLMQIQPGQIFSREKLNASTKSIGDRLGASGYAFANVNAVPEIDKEKHQVAFTIFVDPGKRVYVRRINISGNTKTRDEVIRREFRQMEGAWYDADAVTRSKQRVDRLGFFQDVNVETPAVAGTPDQVDVNMNVTERPTGALMVGAGFSSTEKVVLSASISQNNIFGTGNNMALSVNSGRINRVYSLSWTNPYFTSDGISQGFDIYHRTVDPTVLSVGNYRTASTGGGVRWGIPIGEKESVNFGIGYDRTQITTYNDSPTRYKNFVRDNGSNNNTIPVTLGWTSDGKDSYFYPTSGTVHRFGTEIAAPGGSLKYYRATYQLQQFVPVTRAWVLQLGGEFGIANGYGGKDLPFYKNFYAGGIGSVRGYAAAGIGPRDTNADGTLSDDRLGGNRRVLANAELMYALSGYEKSVRLGTFFDMGQVYAKEDRVDLGQLRKSYGVSLTWISPVGPLKFSIANPMGKHDGDKLERFQFQLGTVF
jgi:outer membrane protein insertion porin family